MIRSAQTVEIEPAGGGHGAQMMWSDRGADGHAFCD
jgi:hypothetical protein